MSSRKRISPLLAGRVHLGTVPDPEAQNSESPSSRRPVGEAASVGHPTPLTLTVAILAGGLGTRLRSVLPDRPKVLAEVGGRPFLSWWLDALDRQGFREIVLCAGYKAEQLRQTLGARHGKLSLRYSVEAQPLGTGGALRHALTLFQSNPVLILNGDSFCDVDLRAFVDAHASRRAQASLVVAQADDTGRFGRVAVRPDWSVERFDEKCNEAGPGWINAGIYLVSRGLLAALPEQQPISLERDLLPGWLAGGVHACAATGKFIDIGTPESLALAEGFFAGLNRAAA